MGRNSSGVRGGLQPGDSNYKGKITGVESLVKMKDPQMYKGIKAAISRFHSVLGVREKNIKLATLSAGTLGVQVSSGGKSEAIYLNKSYFNKGKKAVEASTRKGYASGWHTKTNKPLAHTVTHELAHATWNSSLSGANHKAAGKERLTLLGQPPAPHCAMNDNFQTHDIDFYHIERCFSLAIE